MDFFIIPIDIRIYKTMSAQNEMMMNIIETDVIATAVVVEELPVSLAEILEADFRNDDEAEFLQAVLQIQTDIENVLISDTPEEFLLPTEDDLPPALIMIEKLEELKSFAFGDRTLARIERRLRPQNEVIRPPLNETDKANNPAYRKCPKCLRHFTKRYLGFHMDTAVCLKVAAAHNLRPMGNDKRKVSEKIYIACLDLEDLYARAIDYRKNIEGELEEEEIETSDSDVEVEDDECVYVIKTYEFNHQEKTIDYAGLWENCDGEKEWSNEDDARIEFEYATEGDKGFISVELVKIDPTKNENRETTIDEWEDNISDYVESEEEEEDEV